MTQASAAVCSVQDSADYRTDVTQLIKLVRDNRVGYYGIVISHEEYNLVERKLAVWNRTGGAMNGDRIKLWCMSLVGPT